MLPRVLHAARRVPARPALVRSSLTPSRSVMTATRPAAASASSGAGAGSVIKDAEALGVGRLNHVAIAVPDLKASTALWRDVMGARVSGEQALPEHGVTVVFVELGNTKFELLEVLGDGSPVANFMEKNPSGGIHHVCLEVEDIEESVRRLKAAGVRVLNEKPKIGAHGNPVVFLHPKSTNGVLVELEQPE
jgi:methylmalonyl-CoA/ethylmalonyl-CoA epimerase